MTILEVLRIVGVSHLTFVLIILVVSTRISKVVVFVVFLGLSSISFLLFPFVLDTQSFWLEQLLRFFRASPPFWFWLLALQFFQEDFHLRWWHWLPLLLKESVHFLMRQSYFQSFNFAFSGDDLMLSTIVIALIAVILVSHGIFKAVKDYTSDLIEWRRYIRIVFIVVGGISIIILILSRLVFRGPDLYNIFEYISVSIVLIIVFAFGLVVMRIRSDFLLDDSNNNTKEEKIDLELQKIVIDRMELQKEYRDDNLTIRILASRLGVMEYKLRKLINIGLKYKNFNDFLNRYRIQEVSERLLSEPEIPITRLAMDAGFRSLGTFNRAFRQLVGVSPSIYKKTGGKSENSNG